MDGDRKPQHEKAVQGFPLLPDQPRQGEGGHQGDGKGDQDGGDGNDYAVQEIDAHVAGAHGAGVVGPQPVPRKPHHVVAENFRVVLQRKGEHPVNREKVYQHPEDEADIGDNPQGFVFISHPVSSPL